MDKMTHIDKVSQWQYDEIFSQQDANDNYIEQQMITIKRREQGRVEVETVTRRFYGNKDYQDSTETKVYQW
tara:strand:- start:248 stop:460 length:213 start_codon:yes stop_codon:yes gene_type:complete